MKFITIGSDPEFFVRDPKGKPYPATLFAKGTKDSPSPIEGMPGFFEQRDNLSFEGNIPPAKNKKEFITNVTLLREYFSNKVSRVGYSLSPNGVEYFHPRYLTTPEGMEFGCSSVVSVWDSIPNDIFETPTPVMNQVKYRVAGFHIHIGYDHAIMGMSKEETDLVVGRLFDLFLTGPSQVIRYEPERLKSYGKYGRVRLKDYGIECRTLSTFFTQEKYLSWVWDQIIKIEQFINLCDLSELKHLIKDRHVVYSYGRMEDIFRSVFRDITFKNDKLINTFDETKAVFGDRRLFSDIPSIICIRNAVDSAAA